MYACCTDYQAGAARASNFVPLEFCRPFVFATLIRVRIHVTGESNEITYRGPLWLIDISMMNKYSVLLTLLIVFTVRLAAGASDMRRRAAFRRPFGIPSLAHEANAWLNCRFGIGPFRDANAKRQAKLDNCIWSAPCLPNNDLPIVLRNGSLSKRFRAPTF